MTTLPVMTCSSCQIPRHSSSNLRTSLLHGQQWLLVLLALLAAKCAPHSVGQRRKINLQKKMTSPSGEGGVRDKIQKDSSGRESWAVPSTTTTTTQSIVEQDTAHGALPFHVNDASQLLGLTKCYDTLTADAGDDNIIDQQEYLKFLSSISNGDLAYQSFADLPALYWLIFFTTACSYGQDCVTRPPVISLVVNANNTQSSSMIGFFCREIMTNTYSTISVRFEYTIQYDDMMVTAQNLTICLQQATDNLLLDQLGGCPFDLTCNLTLSDSVDTTPQQRMRQKRRLVSSNDSPAMRLNGHLDVADSQDSSRQHRRLTGNSTDIFNKAILHDPVTLQHLLEQQTGEHINNVGNGNNSNDDNNDVDPASHVQCMYNIDATVDKVIQLSCDNTNITDPSIQCSLIRSTASVVAAQIVEPDEHSLRQRTVQVLRNAINTGSFENYIPNSCLSSTSTPNS